MHTTPSLPFAVIGAGPIGLAAAAHLHERGLPFVLFEAGPTVAAAIQEWSHVHLFSPWEYNIDPAAERLLRSTGWTAPAPQTYPTGGELVSEYLAPLGRVPAVARHTRLNARVTGITRHGRDKMKADGARARSPFRIRYETPSGEEEVLARAVIDTAGTWYSPNPLGSEGLPARGERSLHAFIRYGIPDVLHRDRARYAGRRVLVAGSGHSAFNVIMDLMKLAEQEPATSLTWVVRRDNVGKLFGGGERDQLAARGALGLAVRRLLDSGRLELVLSFRPDAVERTTDGIVVRSGETVAGPVDEIIVATGFRPDFSYLRELQLGLDSIVETTPALAPMIDPNLHSCGTVRPHGHAELAHLETGFYIAGMKSYGRAPTFLMRTGYEQVRSIVAALAGDFAAADRVELVLPETGVCAVQRNDHGAEGGCCGVEVASRNSATHSGDSCGCGAGDAEPELATTVATSAEDAGCCGGAPKSDETACCKKDEEAKAAGATGCGCGSNPGATKTESAAAVALRL